MDVCFDIAFIVKSFCRVSPEAVICASVIPARIILSLVDKSLCLILSCLTVGRFDLHRIVLYIRSRCTGCA